MSRFLLSKYMSESLALNEAKLQLCLPDKKCCLYNVKHLKHFEYFHKFEVY
jgi:hypothetical protein